MSKPSLHAKPTRKRWAHRVEVLEELLLLGLRARLQEPAPAILIAHVLPPSHHHTHVSTHNATAASQLQRAGSDQLREASENSLHEKNTTDDQSDGMACIYRVPLGSTWKAVAWCGSEGLQQIEMVSPESSRGGGSERVEGRSETHLQLGEHQLGEHTGASASVDLRNTPDSSQHIKQKGNP